MIKDLCRGIYEITICVYYVLLIVMYLVYLMGLSKPAEISDKGTNYLTQQKAITDHNFSKMFYGYVQMQVIN